MKKTIFVLLCTIFLEACSLPAAGAVGGAAAGQAGK